jgi:hypothetical protein
MILCVAEMKRIILTILLFFISLSGFAASLITPVEFEQIWLQNNQRNLFKRYYYYNEQLQVESKSLYHLGLDAAPDKTILTSVGEKDALISRMNIYYQSPKYLFLIDWFSAIPQPQDTEGFVYGDFIVGRSWQFPEKQSYLTLGLRQKATPRTVIVNSEIVFDGGSDATALEYSLFFHFNYHGYDFGSYYSEDNELEAIAFNIPLLKTDEDTLTSRVYYYRDVLEINLSERYEVALDYEMQWAEHQIMSGVVFAVVPDLDKNEFSNLYANYQSPSYSGLRWLGGLYYYRDIENAENLPGGKLGLMWESEGVESFKFTISVQQNALGDINALIVRDEPILSFTISASADNLFATRW